MTQFNKKALDLIKNAVFANKPYLIITLDGITTTNAYQGSERDLTDAIHVALNSNPELRNIVRKALNKPEITDFVQSSQTLTIN